MCGSLLPQQTLRIFPLGGIVFVAHVSVRTRQRYCGRLGSGIDGDGDYQIDGALVIGTCSLIVTGTWVLIETLIWILVVPLEALRELRCSVLC